MQKYVTLFIIAFVYCFSAKAQREHDGGSRGGNEVRQDQALNRNFDSRFLPFKDVIHHQLKRQVGQVVQNYESIGPDTTRIAPDEFVALQIAAKGSKVSASTLIASIKASSMNVRTKYSQAANLGHEERRSQFSQVLTSALSQMGVADAQTKADAAIRIVQRAEE